MKDYISVSSDSEENSLTHHGVKGMKWGRRKKRPTSGKSLNKKKSSVKKSIQKKLANVDKEKVKSVAKTTAVIAGGVALSAILGAAGLHSYYSIIGATPGSAFMKKEGTDDEWRLLNGGNKVKRNKNGGFTFTHQ